MTAVLHRLGLEASDLRRLGLWALAAAGGAFLVLGLMALGLFLGDMEAWRPVLALGFLPAVPACLLLGLGSLARRERLTAWRERADLLKEGALALGNAAAAAGAAWILWP